MAKFVCIFLAMSLALASAQTNYNAGDSARSESVGPDGSVQGQYSYTDATGKLITVKYRAGKDGYHVEGDHLPKSPSAGPGPQQQSSLPAVPQHTDPAVTNYNPFYNPNVPNHLQAAAQATPPVQQARNYNYNPQPQNNYNPQAHNNNGYNHHHQSAAPVLPNVPQHTDPAVTNYNPLYNPFLNQQVPQAPAPTHPPAPQYNHHHQPAPQYNQHHQSSSAPVLPNVPQHTDPAVTNYNPFVNELTAGYNPFHNPHVPASLYRDAPRSNYQQPAQPNYNSYSHPNSLPGTQYNNKGLCAGCGPY